MPRQGDGTYIRENGVFTGPQTWTQQGNSADKFINTGRHDTHDQDLADAITGSLARDGQGGMTGILNMGANRIASLANATQPTDALTLGQLDDVLGLLSVVRYGAVGDGVADDSSAVGSAIDTSLALGIPVYFPGGKTYLVSGLVGKMISAELRIILGPGAVIKGAGQGPADGSGTPLFDMRASLMVEGQGTFSSFGPVFDWSNATADINHVIVRNGVSFVDTGRALYWQDQGNDRGIVDRLDVQGCYLNNCRDGVHFAVDKLGQVNVSNNFMETIGSTTIPTADGVHLGNEDTLNYLSRLRAILHGNIIRDVQSLSETHGISTRMGYVSIIGNYIQDLASADGTDEEGIYTKSFYSTVNHNILVDAGGDGNGVIAIKGEARGSADTPGNNTVVQGNQIRNTGGDKSVGIGIFSEDMNVSDNQIDGNFRVPFDLRGPATATAGRLQCKGNQVTNCQHGTETMKVIAVSGLNRDIVIANNILTDLSVSALDKRIFAILIDNTENNAGDISNVLVHNNIIRNLTASGGGAALTQGVRINSGTVAGDTVTQVMVHRNLFDGMTNAISLQGSTRPTDMIDIRLEDNTARNLTSRMIDNQVNYPASLQERGNTLDGVREPGIGEDVTFQVAVDQSGLAGGGVSQVLEGFQLQNYKMKSIVMSGDGTNFSGGNRNLQVFSGSIVWTVIPSGTLQNLSAGGAHWGDGTARVPYPAVNADQFAETADGANINVSYVDGTTDYTVGLINLQVTVERTR